MKKNNKPLIVITGASSGIGRATALYFSEKGHPLLLVARRLQELKKLNLPNASYAQVDVTDLNALRRAVAGAEDQYGPVSCMVNNAGAMFLGRIDQQNPVEWGQMLDVNVIGVLNGIKVVLNTMMHREKGTVINISSVVGKKAAANHAVYCATKAAVNALTEVVREEAAKYNIRFINIMPGVVETNLLESTSDQNIKKDYRQWKKTLQLPLYAMDVAKIIGLCYEQPEHVCIRELIVAPTTQIP